jgi:hypothetical protein
MELVSVPGNVRVTSSPSFRAQAGAIFTVAVIVVFALFLPTSERLVCDDTGACSLHTRRLFGSKTTQLGSADRIVAVEQHTHRNRSSGRRHTSPQLVLTAPDERISVDGDIASSVDAWLEGRIYQEGRPQPAKTLPFRASWHAGGVMIGACLLLAIFAAVVALRSVVRYELALRGTTLSRRVTRVFVWTRETVIPLPFALHARHRFEIMSFLRPRRSESTRSWGVWCETTPGAGHWVAAGLTEVEAETIVDTFMSPPKDSALYPAGGG